MKNRQTISKTEDSELFKANGSLFFVCTKKTEDWPNGFVLQSNMELSKDGTYKHFSLMMIP